MKYRYQMPVLFKNLAEEFALNLQPFSKFRLAVSALGLATGPAADVPNPQTLHYA